MVTLELTNCYRLELHYIALFLNTDMDFSCSVFWANIICYCYEYLPKYVQCTSYNSSGEIKKTTGIEFKY